MDFINQDYFDRPESRELAEGKAIDRISPEATALKAPKAGILRRLAYNGGIENPKEDDIKSGTTLIRFSRGPFIDNLAGGEWWLDMAANKQVETYATRNGISIQESLSRLCAVPAEWNDMTLKVQFMTLAPLKVYKGPGKDAFYETREGRVERRKVEMIDGMKVTQLFIPGLNHPDLRRRALLDRGSVHMPSFRRG
jgi:hypothetical protein